MSIDYPTFPGPLSLQTPIHSLSQCLQVCPASGQEVRHLLSALGALESCCGDWIQTLKARQDRGLRAPKENLWGGDNLYLCIQLITDRSFQVYLHLKRNSLSLLKILVPQW